MKASRKEWTSNSISICTLKERALGQLIPSPRSSKLTQITEAVQAPITVMTVAITPTRNSGYQRNVWLMGSSPAGESQLSPFGRRDKPSFARQYTNERVKACNPQHWQSGNLKRSIRCIAKQWSFCFMMVKSQSDLEGQCAGNDWKNYITHFQGNINHLNAWCRSCKARSIQKKFSHKSQTKHERC